MFKEKDFKDDLTSKAIMNNDKLLLIAPPQPVPSHLPLQYKPMEIKATPTGSHSTKLVVFDDTVRVDTPKEIPLPSSQQSTFHVVGGSF